MHEGPAPDVKRSLKAAADSSATWIFFPSFVVPVCWGHRTAICWPTVEGSLPNAAVRWVSQREKMRSTQMLRGGQTRRVKHWAVGAPSRAKDGRSLGCLCV